TVSMELRTTSMAQYTRSFEGEALLVLDVVLLVAFHDQVLRVDDRDDVLAEVAGNLEVHFAARRKRRYQEGERRRRVGRDLARGGEVPRQRGRAGGRRRADVQHF